MRALALMGVLFFVAACGSKQVSSKEAQEDLSEGLQVGETTKQDLISSLGTANWCRPQDGGGETCRFYRKQGTKWLGEVDSRTHYEQFDEVIAEFDRNGVLREYKTKAQR